MTWLNYKGLRELSTNTAWGRGWNRGWWNILENLWVAIVLKVHRGGGRVHKIILSYFTSKIHVNIRAWLHNDGPSKLCTCSRGSREFFYHHDTFQTSPTPPSDHNCWQLLKASPAYGLRAIGFTSFFLGSSMSSLVFMLW